MDTLGERVTFLRENMEMSQKEFAEKIGISPMTLSKYTKDLNEPRSSTILKMAQVLSTTSDYILGLTNDYSSPNNTKSLENEREQNLLFNFRKLSEKDKNRVEERILTLLENSK